MKLARSRKWISAALALGSVLLLSGAKPTGAQAPTPFEQSVYLYNQAYDADLTGPAGSGTGNWGKYRTWLGITNLGAEADPGWGAGDWWDCCQHVNWNSPWGPMQQRYGAALPTVILGMGQMPSDPSSSDSWNQKLAWEDQQWQLEAKNDPTLLGYFANYAKEVNSLGFSKVTIRLGYEFDGGWNPFGNLNVMSNMPDNYIKAWQNIVTAMRANDPKHLIKFCWNPTDANVQISAQSYYPGDDYVDYIGIDTYDFSYNGEYPVGTAQPTQTQQATAWKNTELPRIKAFADFARLHKKQMVIGEWGLWQLNDRNHPSGGDNPTYIQNMYNWMSDPKNNIAAECYFETPSDGDSSLSGIFHPTAFPNARNMFLKLFGNGGAPSVPPPPTGLTAVGSPGQIKLTWNASVGIPAATYSIYKGTKAGGESAMPFKTGLTVTSYENRNLQDGKTLYYSVKAVNSAGASAASNEASATPGIPANYVLNSGFEAGDTSGWTLWTGSNGGASFAQNCGTATAHSGAWEYTHWSASPYQVTLYQGMTVPNGSHTVSAWVKSSGGQAACQMEVNSNGGSPTVVPITASPGWTQISTTVNVTGGTLSVGFHSNASGNQWLNVDDVVVK